MKTVWMILTICSIVMAMATARETARDPTEVEAWFKNLPYKKEKLTKLHFYFHDTISGKNPTAVVFAKPNFTSTSTTLFGVTIMIDDALTTTLEPSSQIVGRARGMYAFASLEEMGLLMSLSLVFTAGKYNGSTLSVLGHNPVLHKYRELQIVGGSGVFRLARGVATTQNVSFNVTSGNAVVEYDVVVLHY